MTAGRRAFPRLLSRLWPRRWPSPPIAVQIVALLVAGLVAAQSATLALTLLLPPAPAAQHSLADIAAGLRGAVISDNETRPLVRTVETQPPSLQSPGWVASEQSSVELARMLNVDPANVRLLFYAPPPFAGTESRRIDPGPPPLAWLVTSYAEAQTLPGGPRGAPGGRPGFGGGFGGRPGEGGFPGGGFRGIGAIRAAGGGLPGGFPGERGGRFPGQVPGLGERLISQAADSDFRTAQPIRHINDPLFTAAFRQPDGATEDAPARDGTAPPSIYPIAAADMTPARAPAAELLRIQAPTVRTPVPAPMPAPPTPAPESGRKLVAPPAQGLFGLGAAPFIEGDFVAALRVSPGHWVTLKPQPEAFPNSWQRRVLMWFALSFAVVAPLGYIFARRLTAPLSDFAVAAEQLGRDPSLPVMVGDGPAEVGRAARAFNQMQARLTRYITDRTAMMGAISHDLRTPLARMRFRLERGPDALRRELGQDIDQMEAMINSVLAFMRDNGDAGHRHRVDLRSILECVIDDAEVTGADVRLEPGDPVEVEVDVLALQRVFANLVDNAVKYGASAQVALRIEGGEAVTEVRDHGPGLAPGDLERAFTPFYRGAEARASSKQGVGLGLATSRSTVLAHGGDIRLMLPGQGLLVQVRLPLAQVQTRAQAKARLVYPSPEMQAAE